jgi:putative transposase
MREQKLIRRRPVEARRRRPGVFKVERPGQLWHLDMTSVSVAEHGWCYLNAIIDCCTREIVSWSLEHRCRAAEATAVIKQAVDDQGITPGALTLGTEQWLRLHRPLHPARDQRARRDPPARRLPRPRVAGVHRELVSLPQRALRLAPRIRDLEQAREVIAAYIDHYHDRPHSRPNYRTPREVRAAWDDAQAALQKTAA